jgi:elongation factor P
MSLESWFDAEYCTETLEYQTGYMTEELEGMIALLVDGEIVGVEMPQNVILEIIDTAPGIKVNTTNGKFVSRA